MYKKHYLNSIKGTLYQADTSRFDIEIRDRVVSKGEILLNEMRPWEFWVDKGVTYAAVNDFFNRRVVQDYVMGVREYLNAYGLGGYVMIDEAYIEACEKRRKSVEKALAIVMTAINGTDEKNMDVLDSYIMGKISLEEMEARIDRLKYLKQKSKE